MNIQIYIFHAHLKVEKGKDSNCKDIQVHHV